MRCKRCGGYVYTSVLGRVSCLNCGREHSPAGALEITLVAKLAAGNDGKRKPREGKCQK